MGFSKVEIPVFADTNLGTRIVVVVSPQTTAYQFKRELEMAHLNCFPHLGQIKVDVVMVKRNSCFYHLPDTLPLKYVFQHLKGIKSLHVEACQYSLLNQLDSSEHVDDQIWDQYDDVSTIFGPTKLRTSMDGTNFEKLKCRRKRNKMKRLACLKAVLPNVLSIIHFSKMKKKKRGKARKSCRFNGLTGPTDPLVVSKESFDFCTFECEGKGDKEHNSSRAIESHCDDLSEADSVSGIIRKYFSSHDEVDSSSRFSHGGAQSLRGEQTRVGTYLCDLNVERGLLSPFSAKTPLEIPGVPLPNESISRASRNKSKRIEIGSRLISASQSIGLIACKKKNSTPTRSATKSASFIQSLVFEMSDED